MRTLLFLFVLLLLLSCGSSKKISSSEKERKISVAAADDTRKGVPSALDKETPPKVNPINATATADLIINTALTFSGVRYKFGGTTTKGMDCSGLLYVSFGEHDIALPRTSYHMAEKGERIRVKDVQKGDLLFFKTSKGFKRINHVGMVVETTNNEIIFIHASTSRGVTVSSLRDGFWNQAFVKATRIL